MQNFISVRDGPAKSKQRWKNKKTTIYIEIMAEMKEKKTNYTLYICSIYTADKVQSIYTWRLS